MYGSVGNLRNDRIHCYPTSYCHGGFFYEELVIRHTILQMIQKNKKQKGGASTPRPAFFPSTVRSRARGTRLLSAIKDEPPQESPL